MGNSQSTRPSGGGGVTSYVSPIPMHLPPRSTSRSETSSPIPGQVHKSMRSKKRSLELPDFEDHPAASVNPYSSFAYQSQSRGRSMIYGAPPKSASIPIPVQTNGNGGAHGAGRGAKQNGSGSGEMYYAVQPSTHIERGRGGPPPAAAPPQKEREREAESMVPSSVDLVTPGGPGAPPPTRNPSTVPLSEPQTVLNGASMVVRSTIPLALPKALDYNPRDVTIERVGLVPAPTADLLTVKISWHGGGQSVFLARAGDDDWNGRQKMIRDSIDPTTFSTTVTLHPGTHHLRFLVDDQWRVADDLPTAVDDQGSLANYVDISTSKTPTDSYVNSVPAHDNLMHDAPPLPWEEYPSQHQHQPYHQQIIVQNIPAAVPEGGTLANLGRLGKGQSFWSASSTNEHDVDSEEAFLQHIEHASVPPEDLSIRAGPGQRAEAMSGVGETKSRPSGTGKPKYVTQWTTEIPLELFEAAREEEAYLAHQQELMNQQQQRRKSHPHSHLHSQYQTQYEAGFVPLPNIPPAPGLPRYLDKLILNTHMRPVVSAAAAGVVSSSQGPGGGNATSSVARRKEKERKALNALGLVTSPTSPVSPTSIDSTAALPHSQVPQTLTAALAAAIDPNAPTAGPLPVTTASGTDVTSVVLGVPSLGVGVCVPGTVNEEDEGVALGNGTVAGGGSMGSGGGNTVVIDDMIIADDASVLPVPSHVVLHHLCTSAIKNGVLAVGETVRYRKKYLTTIYYKPISSYPPAKDPIPDTENDIPNKNLI